jgi:UDP-glucose 4-epimerase
MKCLVTGSAGHLGEGLIRTLRELKHEVVGLDLLDSPFTTHIGSIVSRSTVADCMDGVEMVFHVATLHKPHLATHSRQDFIDTNITGTLHMLEEAVATGVKSFIYTSTTSVFGEALAPPPGTPAAWITEDVVPVPKNIYGVTKAAAEDICQLFHRNLGLPCIVLRTSRFFPEEDDNREMRLAFSDENLKANEYLFRRVDVEDVVSAHILAAERAGSLGFRKYIISATSPFGRKDVGRLRENAPAVVREYVQHYEAEYQSRDWRMFPDIGRVYINERARDELGWRPRYDFHFVVDQPKVNRDFRSPLARSIGSKGYHAEAFSEGPYPIE